MAGRLGAGHGQRHPAPRRRWPSAGAVSTQAAGIWNRRMRTCMSGAVGAGRSILRASRLGIVIVTAPLVESHSAASSDRLYHHIKSENTEQKYRREFCMEPETPQQEMSKCKCHQQCSPTSQSVARVVPSCSDYQCVLCSYRASLFMAHSAMLNLRIKSKMFGRTGNCWSSWKPL